MQRLGHAVDGQVHLDIVIGKPARHLFADDHVDVAAIRPIVQQLERAVDGIVIGERHQIHAARLGHPVHVGRLRVAVAAAQKAHGAGDFRMTGVNVKIGAQQRHHWSGFSNRIWSVVDPSAS